MHFLRIILLPYGLLQYPQLRPSRHYMLITLMILVPSLNTYPILTFTIVRQTVGAGHEKDCNQQHSASCCSRMFHFFFVHKRTDE